MVIAFLNMTSASRLSRICCRRQGSLSGLVTPLYASRVPPSSNRAFWYSSLDNGGGILDLSKFGIVLSSFYQSSHRSLEHALSRGSFSILGNAHKARPVSWAKLLGPGPPDWDNYLYTKSLWKAQESYWHFAGFGETFSGLHCRSLFGIVEIMVTLV